MRFELPGCAEDRAKRRSQIPEWIAAAEAGSVDAQLALAWEYARGDVIQVDIANAWYWFERAAGSGQDIAVVNWARFLQLRGVPEGVRALRKLAFRGDWKAQFWLAQNYQLHAGRLNQLRAVVWYDRSFDIGNQAANLAKLGQLTRVAPFRFKLIFAGRGIVELVMMLWRMGWHKEQIELYEPLLYRLKSRSK